MRRRRSLALVLAFLALVMLGGSGGGLDPRSLRGPGTATGTFVPIGPMTGIALPFRGIRAE